MGDLPEAQDQSEVLQRAVAALDKLMAMVDGNNGTVPAAPVVPACDGSPGVLRAGVAGSGYETGRSSGSNAMRAERLAASPVAARETASRSSQASAVVGEMQQTDSLAKSLAARGG